LEKANILKKNNLYVMDVTQKWCFWGRFLIFAKNMQVFANHVGNIGNVVVFRAAQKAGQV
jgi:epoxyqueuosine reductase QueG